MQQIPFRLNLIVVPLLALLTLSACSTTKPFGLGSEPTPPYGDYLLARYASSEADVKVAAKYYMRALKGDPDNSELRQRALLSSVFAGNVKQAAELARITLDKSPNDRLAVLIAVSDDIKSRRYSEAISILEDAKLGPLNQVAGGLLHGWALQGLGDTDAAILVMDGVMMSPVLGDFALFHKALILMQAGKETEAEEYFTKAMASGLLNQRTAYGWASMQLEMGNEDSARELIESRVLANKYEVEAGYLLSSLELGARRKPAFPNVRTGAAEALFGPGRALAERSLHELAIIYLELAVYIDPEHDAARELLGRLYDVQGRTDDALSMFAKISQKQPWYLQAQLDAANALFRAQRREEGVAMLIRLNKTMPGIRAQRALARALQADKKFEQALQLYNEIIEKSPDEADSQLYFSRAICLERTGRWREAVPDFRKSLSLNPNQADVLNYLGYTFVDNESNVEEGFSLIRRAIELAPRAGYIVDSLGWGYYRLGRYDEAVTELERAVELEPAEPTINDHLGDAYWQVGRKLEAKFQWQRVLSLEPDEEVDLALVNNKIENGLIAVAPTKIADDAN